MTAKTKQSEVDVMNEINRVPMTKESWERMSLNIYDLQYLIRLQDLSNEAFKQTFDEEFRKDLVVSIAKELAEVLAPINDKLAELARGQSELVKGQLEMAADITEIKEKMHILEEDVDGTKKQIKDITIECSKRDKVLKDLKTKVEALQPDSIIEIRKEMKELSPLLKKSVKVNSIWNIALRIVAGIILGISLVWLLLKYTWNLL